ncbi:MAG: hypothetical protein ACE5OZ_12460 [Candidatus Heimdallarchaeota archaeon]
MVSEEKAYFELAKIWRQEREELSLTALPPDFFPRFHGQLLRFKSKAKGSLETDIVNRFAFMLADLVNLRSEKILANLRLNLSAKDTMHLTREERLLVDPLSNIIPRLQSLPSKEEKSTSALPADNNRGNDDQSEEFKLRPNEIQMTHSSHENSSEKPADSFTVSKELVLVRVVKPVEGRFVGTDGFQYGPLAIGDIVCLPYQNEKALVSRGVAVEIEIGWN